MWSALNTQDPEGNSGDWHSYFLLPEELKYAGEGCDVNTIPWLALEGVRLHLDYNSLPTCQSRDFWKDFPGPYRIANHRRAAIDLLFNDFVINKEMKGRTVDLYGWIDKTEDIQKIFQNFEIIIHDISTTTLAVNSNDWNNYKKWIWRRFDG